MPGAGTVSGEAKITADSKNLNAEYILTPDRDVALNSLHVAANFDVAALAGARWVADGQSGLFPKDFVATSLFNGSIRSLKLELPTGAWNSRFRNRPPCCCRTIGNGTLRL